MSAAATLSGTTGYFRSRWATTLRTLGDERVRAEGLGPTLAAMIRATPCGIPDLERAASLNSTAIPAAASITSRPAKGAS